MKRNVGALLALAVLVPAPLFAQDECAAAVPIQLGEVLPFTTVGATPSPVAWVEACGAGIRNDVWFRFDAPSDGTYRASSCGSRDSSLELFTGACGALVQIDCDNGRCRFDSSFSRGGKVYFHADQGETIYARIGTWLAGSSDTWGDFQIVTATSAPNDAMLSPSPIDEGDTVYIDLFGATRETAPPPCGLQYGGDLWFEFTPTASGTFEASTCDILGALIPATSVSVYTGPSGALVLQGCSGGGCSTPMGARHTFFGAAGTRYTIRVLGTVYFNEGDFTLRRIGGSPDDECATAPDIQSGVFEPFNLAGATPSARAFACGTPAAGDVWRRYVVPADGTYEMYCYALGSASSTRLALEVHRGPCGASSVIGCDVATSSVDSPQVVVQATAGEVLHVRVGANQIAGVSGDVRVVPGPANDDCVGATPLPLGTWVDFNTGEANASSFGWACAAPTLDDDVWFRVDAPTTGPLTVAVEDPANALRFVEVYEGSCAAPVFVACAPAGSTPFARRVVLSALAGATYFIRVNDPNYDADGRILVSEGAAPPEDECNQAAPLVFGDNAVELFFATESTLPAGACGFGSLVDVWYTFTAARDARVGLFTCADNGRALQLFEGQGCFVMNEIDCKTFDLSSHCFPSPGQSIVADVQQGLTYYVCVRGVPGSSSVLEAFEWLPGSVGTPFCSAVPNSTGLGARISAEGSPAVLANDLTLGVTQLPVGVVTMFVVGDASGFTANPGGSQGNLCLGGRLGRYNRPGELRSADATGEVSLRLSFTRFDDLPNQFVPPVAGQTWFFQAWYRDQLGGVPVSNFSDGLDVVLE